VEDQDTREEVDSVEEVTTKVVDSEEDTTKEDTTKEDLEEVLITKEEEVSVVVDTIKEEDSEEVETQATSKEMDIPLESVEELTKPTLADKVVAQVDMDVSWLRQSEII